MLSGQMWVLTVAMFVLFLFIMTMLGFFLNLYMKYELDMINHENISYYPGFEGNDFHF